MGEQACDQSQRERYLRWVTVAGVLVGWGLYRFCQRRWSGVHRRGPEAGGVPTDLGVRTATSPDFAVEEETESIEITAYVVPDLDEVTETPVPAPAVPLAAAFEPPVAAEGQGAVATPPTPEPSHAVEEQVEAPPSSDDLRRIEGIGPKVAAILGAAGITTFEHLATVDLEPLRELLRAAGLPFMDPASWPQQATFAAQGDWNGLATLQIALKGGRSR